ncbi:extensin-like [Iris pallida]|uniref:Extensin-like n=1 Tax=Iris pallida TaxID=29817 RepID=A0AAX6GIF2_IRIPA|nr:extensin-like [Iris pallida]
MHERTWQRAVLGTEQRPLGSGRAGHDVHFPVLERLPARGFGGEGGPREPDLHLEWGIDDRCWGESRRGGRRLTTARRSASPSCGTW